MKKFFLVLILLVLAIYLGIFTYENIICNNKDANTMVTKENSVIKQEKQTNQEQEVVKEDRHIKMTVIGDIMCHNSQYRDAYITQTGTYDFSYVFTDIKQYIDTADIAIGNLETTFAGKERGYSNYPRFNTPEQLAIDLKEFGIDVLSTANNHCMDTSYTGLVSTIKYLDEAQISHTGTYQSKEEQNKILVKEVNGIKIAFIAFTYGTNGISIPKDKNYAVNLIDKDLMLKQIELAKKENPDIICANMHWGIEYQTRQNSEQEKLANLLFENGVDIILGSHPHVLQPMEKKTIKLEDGTIKNCFVIYSLGNFMSAQTMDNTKNSVILNIEMTKIGETEKTVINKVEYIPIYMYRAPASKEKRYKVLDIEKSISNYDTGIDKSIGITTYNTLKRELAKIRKIVGENIEF